MSSDMTQFTGACTLAVFALAPSALDAFAQDVWTKEFRSKRQAVECLLDSQLPQAKAAQLQLEQFNRKRLSLQNGSGFVFCDPLNPTHLFLGFPEESPNIELLEEVKICFDRQSRLAESHIESLDSICQLKAEQKAELRAACEMQQTHVRRTLLRSSDEAASVLRESQQEADLASTLISIGTSLNEKAIEGTDSVFYNVIPKVLTDSQHVRVRQTAIEHLISRLEKEVPLADEERESLSRLLVAKSLQVHPLRILEYKSQWQLLESISTYEMQQILPAPQIVLVQRKL